MTKSIIEIAIETIAIEIHALQQLQASINEHFTKAIELITISRGRVVVTGIGKSAIVAQKIVATMNSTGTPALFMHAADAIHGDLGMIRGGDIVICLSKSGDTPEIKVLLPILKNFGNPLIAIVANPNSFLAQAADAILLTPIEKEADPNNLAPTASTTAQMVMGDAIAMALLAQKGFSAQDFAQFHPGGALGKQLYLRVDNIYGQNQRPAVLQDATIQEVIVEISSKRLGAAAVVDDAQQLLGVITDGDLRRMLSQNIDLKILKAKNIMTHNPKTIEKDTLAVQALAIMQKNSITQLIVVKGNTYLGIIHLHDLLREGIA